MTSRWIRSAPAATTRRTALARLARSASRMLAAITARPPTALLPYPDRHRLVAAFSAKRGRALGFQPLAAPGHGRRRGIAGAFGCQLPAGGADFLPSVPADRRPDACLTQRPRELLDRRHRARLPGRMSNRVHRDEVHVGVVATQQVREGFGVGRRVVHATDHRVLVADPPTSR